MVALSYLLWEENGKQPLVGDTCFRSKLRTMFDFDEGKIDEIVGESAPL